MSIQWLKTGSKNCRWGDKQDQNIMLCLCIHNINPMKIWGEVSKTKVFVILHFDISIDNIYEIHVHYYIHLCLLFVHLTCSGNQFDLLLNSLFCNGLKHSHWILPFIYIVKSLPWTLYLITWFKNLTRLLEFLRTSQKRFIYSNSLSYNFAPMSMCCQIKRYILRNKPSNCCAQLIRSHNT